MKILLIAVVLALLAPRAFAQDTPTPTETKTPTETVTPTETETLTPIPRPTDTPTANATQTFGMSVEKTAAANSTRTAAVPTAVVTPQPTGNPNENTHVTSLELTLWPVGDASVRYAPDCISWLYTPLQKELCRCVLYSKRVAGVDTLNLRCPDGTIRAVTLVP